MGACGLNAFGVPLRGHSSTTAIFPILLACGCRTRAVMPRTRKPLVPPENQATPRWSGLLIFKALCSQRARVRAGGRGQVADRTAQNTTQGARVTARGARMRLEMASCGCAGSELCPPAQFALRARAWASERSERSLFHSNCRASRRLFFLRF